MKIKKKKNGWETERRLKDRMVKMDERKIRDRQV